VADINKRGSKGWLPIEYAVHRRDVKEINTLLGLGAKPESAMKYALEEETTEILRLLLQHSTLPNSKPVVDAMCKAVQLGKVTAIKLFLQKGTQPCSLNSLGDTPLKCAVWGDQLKIFRQLITLCPQSKYQLENLLSDSIQSNANSIMQEILQSKKIDINWQDKSGKTFLMHSVISKNAEGLRILLLYKPQIKLKDKSGRSVIDWAIELNEQETLNIIKNLFVSQNP